MSIEYEPMNGHPSKCIAQSAYTRVFTLRAIRWQWIACVLLCASAMVGGCAQPKGVLFEPLDIPLNWPPPPETSRIHYVGSLSTDKDLKPAKSFTRSVSETLFGEKPGRSMLTPYAVCTDGRDRVFVCDSNAQVVHVFDLDSRAYEQWKPDALDGSFAQPVGITFDSLDRLLVSDSAGGIIHVFNSSGQYQGTLGEGALSKPSGLVTDPETNRIFVADVGTHQIVVLSFDGELLERIGQRGTSLGEFNFPTNVALGQDGSLYVSDSLNFRVQVLDPDLKPARQVGQKGDLPGYFSHPKGIALDQYGHLYVIDSHFESVQIFDPQGNLLLTFGQEGHEPGQFWLPTGIHIDGNNRIFIADSYNQRLQVFEYRPEEQQ